MSDVVLLTPRETAKRLCCSERKLERHRLHGDGPPFLKFGGSVRYSVAELEAWIAANVRRSTSDPGPQPPSRRRRRAGEADSPAA